MEKAVNLYCDSTDDIKVGNWISLKYPGSLIAAHKVLEVREYGVVIEKGETNAFLKMGSNREYPELLQTRVVDFNVRHFYLRQ